MTIPSPSPAPPSAPTPVWVFALKAVSALAIMLIVLVMLSRAVELLANHSMDQVPGSLWVSLLLLVGSVGAVIRGNVSANRPDHFEGGLAALAVAPGVLVVGVSAWAVLASVTPMAPTLIVYGLSLILGLGAAGALLYLWGPRAAARTAAEAARAAVQAERAGYQADAAARRRATTSGTQGGPARGQVWWAPVPYEEKAENKDRPILVLDVDDKFVWGLYFTSTDHRGDGNFVLAPASMWREPKDSYLRMDRALQLGREGLRKRECFAPQRLLEQVDEWRDQHPRAAPRPCAMPQPNTLLG